MDTKRCPVCKETKPVTEFNKNKYNKDGLQSRCKKCASATLKEYRKSHPEYAEKQRANKQTEAYKVKQQQYRQSESAKAKAREFYRNKIVGNPQYQEKQREYRQKKADYYREYARQYNHTPEEKLRSRARWKVKGLIRQGKMPPASSLSCEWEGCTEQASEYHHHKGYEKEYWLDVQALCRKHHGFTRRKVT